jgi:hypothetical protein
MARDSEQKLNLRGAQKAKIPGASDNIGIVRGISRGTGLPKYIAQAGQAFDGAKYPLLAEITKYYNENFELTFYSETFGLLYVFHTGHYYVSADEGVTWTIGSYGVEGGFPFEPFSVAESGDELIVVGYRATELQNHGGEESYTGYALRTIDGTTFTPIFLDFGDSMPTKIARGATHFVCFTNSETVLRSLTGAAWTSVESGVLQEITCVNYVIDAEAFIAVGSSGTVIRSDDEGLTWESVAPEDYEESLNSVASTTALIVAVGNDGKMIKSVDGGLTFTEVVTGEAAYIGQIIRDTTNNVFLMIESDTNGGLIKSATTAAFADLDTGITGTPVWGLCHAASLGKTFVFGDGIVRVTTNATAFTTVASGTNLFAVFYVNDGETVDNYWMRALE